MTLEYGRFRSEHPGWSFIRWLGCYHDVRMIMMIAMMIWMIMMISMMILINDDMIMMIV